MSEDSWPSPNHNSRAVTEAEFEKLTFRAVDDGLYGLPTGPDPVVAGSGLQILIKAGLYANLRGFLWASGPSDVAKTIAPNTSGATRNDRVVLELDRSTWDVRSKIVQGTPGGGPPLITRDLFDTGVYQEMMAEVMVPNNATAVTVIPRPNYVGLRIRVAKSGRHRLNTYMGEIIHEPDTGMWLGHNAAGTDDVLYEQIDWVDLTPTWPTIWQKLGTCAAKKRNGAVSVILQLKRVGNYPKSDPDGTLLVRLPEGMWPVHHWEYRVGQFSSGDSIQLRAQTDGYVYAQHPTTDVPGGAILRAGFSFVI